MSDPSITSMPAEGVPHAAFAASGDRWTIQPIHVLIVDDEAPIRALLRETLSSQGFSVTEAASGTEALDVLKRQPVQIVLADFKLPDCDGIALLEQARHHDPRLVGLVMTGYGTVDVAVKAIKSGALDLLVKPLDPDHLVLVLKRVMEMQRLRSENGLLKQAVLRGGGVRLQDFRLEHIQEGRLPRAMGDGVEASVESAYQRGVVDGERRAREQVGQGLERQQAMLAAVVREFERARCTGLEKAAAEIADLAVAIADKLVRHAVAAAPDFAVADVREALARVPDSQSVTVRVHPDDVAVLEAARPILTAAFEKPVSLKIEAAPSISRGGCFIETPMRFVDATLEAKLARIGQALKGGGHEAG